MSSRAFIGKRSSCGGKAFRSRRANGRTAQWHRMINQVAKSIFLRGLDGVRGGSLRILADQSYTVGDPRAGLHATLAIASDQFYTRALAYGDIGIGESYMDGEWTSLDLVTLIRLML